MSESAITNHAARVLASVSATLPADTALRRYLASARRLGPREKRSVSQAVFNYFRWREWLRDAPSAQKAIEQAWALRERFMANPASVKVEALAARALPEWVKNEGAWPADSLRQIQLEPALWLRARPGTAGHVAAELGHSELPKDLPWSGPGASDGAAVRYNGNQDLFLTPAFHEGRFEIQDLASQAVGYACWPAPGQTWWDACAGEGGKTLHLADLMQNKGLLWASDRSERRLQTLKRRAARAQLFNVRVASWEGTPKLPTKTKFDGVLLDAPCSGTGTWQRNPHARWTTTERDVRELADVQRRLLDYVCGSVKAGGRLVYAVCTLTRSETTEVTDAFTAAHPEFKPVPVFPNGEATQVTLWPHQLKSNGMYIAAWQRE